MRLVLSALAFAVAAIAPRAHAQPAAPSPDAEPWRPKRELSVGTSDWIVTGAALSVALGSSLVAPLPRHARGGVLFDEDARDVLRAKGRDFRYGFRDASDVGVSLASTWPFLVDALLTAWWYRGKPKLAGDMAAVSAQSFALVAALQGVTNNLVSRERPYGRLCGTPELPEETIDCEGNVRYRSFFSGHASLSFTSAGLLCMNHLGLGLLGPPWDALTCASGFTVATATAMFRVVGDMHYVSDVAVGALVGGSIGILVPLLHLTPPVSEPRAGRVDLRFGPVGQGLGVTGTF